MSAKLAMRGIGLALALGALATLYVIAMGPKGDSKAAKAKENAASEEKACGEGCWLPFF
jgi:hypothetical protein